MKQNKTTPKPVSKAKLARDAAKFQKKFKDIKQLAVRIKRDLGGYSQMCKSCWLQSDRVLSAFGKFTHEHSGEMMNDEKLCGEFNKAQALADKVMDIDDLVWSIWDDIKALQQFVR